MALAAHFAPIIVEILANIALLSFCLLRQSWWEDNSCAAKKKKLTISAVRPQQMRVVPPTLISRARSMEFNVQGMILKIL